MAYEEYSRLLRREPKQDLYFVENPNMITTVADIISNPWKGTPQEYLYNMRQEIKQGLSGFIGNRDNAPMPVNPVNSSMSPPIIAQPEVEPYNYTNKVPEIPLSPTAISEEGIRTIPPKPIQLWQGDNRAIVTPEGMPQPEGYVNRGTFSYTGEQKGRFEPGVKYGLNEPTPPPPTFRDIMKKQIGFDPEKFDVEAEAKRMTEEQIRTVAPRGGLTAQQQAQIYHNNLVIAMGQKEKGLAMLDKAEEKFAAQDKTKSVDQRIVGMLRDKLKREPTDEEVLKAIQARDIEKQRLGVSDPLTESALGIEAMKYILTGKFPAFRRDVEKSKISNLAGKIAEEKGWTAQDQLRMQTDFKSMNTSTIAQKKNYDAMHGFVINMDKQMARLETVYAKIPRTQYRLLNIPIVELRARAMGKGEEAAAAALLLELGNESGKLSTNSASSIRELSQTAQEQWAKIHDNKLSFEDLKIVLDTTKKLGHDRLTSTQEAMDFTKDQITALGGGKQPVSPTATGTKKMKPITLKGGKVIYVEE